MIEILLAAGIFLALLFLAFGSGLVHWTTLLVAGAVLLAAGFVLGIIVAIGYHLALYRVLSPLGLLGRDWWWRPTSYNTRLPPEGRSSVMPWFYAGMATIVMDAAGCVVTFVPLYGPPHRATW